MCYSMLSVKPYYYLFSLLVQQLLTKVDIVKEKLYISFSTHKTPVEKINKAGNRFAEGKNNVIHSNWINLQSLRF